MVFRRRRESDEPTDAEDQVGVDEADGVLGSSDGDDVATVPTGPAAGSGKTDSEPYAVSVPTRPNGPWDFTDVPKDDDIPRVDLGGLMVPIFDGVEVRIEVQDDIPVAATLVDGNSAIQIHAFAAPRSSGLWAEVRAEIAVSLNGSGPGSGQEDTGPFGAELRARLPMDDGSWQSARFLGVDGPRWFLRGLMTGPASTDPVQAKQLEEAFRQVVVNRGGDAMAPRDMLPLHLPREAMEAAGSPPDEIDHTLQLPVRGPEITEIQ